MQPVDLLVMLLPFLGGACTAGACGMGHASHGADSGVEAPQAVRPVSDPKFDAARTRRMLDAYDQIVVALAADEVGDVSGAASLIVRDAPNDAIKEAARSMAGAGEEDIAESREHFKALSENVGLYVEGNLESLKAALEKDEQSMPQKAYCPMAEAGWLQHGERITNPYYGKSMLRCGQFQDWLMPAKKETMGHQHQH
jgi:hypothetical protein